ncbi:MAG TPA: TonB-dependent receptor, partial [Rhodanobacter sp.]
KDNAGDYTASLANGFAPRFQITSDTAYLNGTFATGFLKHDLTIGTAGYRADSWSVITPAKAANVLLGSANIYDPGVFPLPAAGLPNVHLAYDSSITYQQGVNVSDTIRFSDSWSTRVGVSQDWFHIDNFNAKGMTVPGYSDNGASPTASLIYKPAQNMTAYFTYVSSLQVGDVAPGTAANAGVGLAPYRSSEYEVGFKASLSALDLTAALFRIERPFANIDPTDDVFKITGDQVSRGFEMSAVGQIVTNLTMYAGFTLLDDKLLDTGVASTNDKTFVGAPRVKGNALFEYQIPAVHGLVASFDWQFTGTRAGNDTNSFVVAGYNLFDLGMRYSQKLFTKVVTWRVAVDNVTDRNYWSTIGPSNLTGANTGNMLAHFGAPRTYLASASIDF